MNRRGLFRHVVVVALFAGVFVVGAGQSAVPRKVGEKAPAFELEDTEGKTHELADYDGRIVVLEWTDPDCPYVQRHYDEQEGATMAGTYRKVREVSEDVVWLAVNSTRGADAERTKQWIEARGVPYPILLDPDGQIGRAYGARRAPQMFVIDAKGVLRYAGAIDSNRLGTTPPDQVTNYVVEVVKQLVADPTAEITQDSVKPYGCEIKFR